MKEDVGLLAVNGHIGRRTLSDWVWWGGDVLVVLVLVEGLIGGCFDRLHWVSFV